MEVLGNRKRIVKVKKLSPYLNEIIVVLSIMQMVLSSTITALEVFQAPVELTLLALLALGCSTIKLNKWQVFLIFILLIVTAFSLFTTDITSFAIVGKNNFLGVLTLIYFSKVPFHSRLILLAFISSVLLLVVNFIIPEMGEMLVVLSAKKEYNLSRFGGFFLNAHFNAYFIAIYFIYFGQRKYAYGLCGVIALYVTASKTMGLSYIGQIATRLPVTKFMTKHHRKLYTFIFLSFFAIFVVFITNYYTILNYIIQKSEMDENRHNSVIVILVQAGTPKYYQQLLNPFPGIYQPKGDKYTKYRPKTGNQLHQGANEIGYFGLVNQAGIFLSLAYLLMLLKNARFYSVFILLTLVHYNFIFTPLSVYMMVQFSRRIQIERNRRAYESRCRLVER